MDLGIHGRRALLLASTSGLGYASALALAREGVRICISGADLRRAEDAARRIADDTGGQIIGLAGDLSDPANMDALARDAQTALGGPIDILFLNHGGPPLRTALEVGQQELVDHANTMMLSLVRIAQLTVPDMVARKWGRVIMVGASSVSEPIPNNVLSNMFRAGLAFYCKTLAGEVIRDGVTVNVVSPTAVLTERTRYTAAARGEKKGISADEELAQREQNSTAGRFGSPDEFGAMVAFLAGTDASYMTGANWRVDGGSASGLG
jgi:3-oxoacyl-[acyl-carrier protein] reductase